tara:strand:- start:8260 stop:8955 length:696 start_codon:yes stop_codon:yes gene_type:complete
MDDINSELVFNGSHLTDNECEAIGIKHIKRKYIKKEAMLYSRKWFDYRQMHPVKATYYFAHCYTAAYKKLMEERLGNHAIYHRGYKGGDPFRASAGQNTSFYKARQYADLLGIPYDFYCNFAMRWANDRLWKRLPRPSHLYSKDLIRAVKHAWDKRLTETIEVPTSKFYMVDGFFNHGDQLEFQHWLLKLIKKRRVPEMALTTYMCLNEYLVEDIVKEYFSDEVIQKALEF